MVKSVDNRPGRCLRSCACVSARRLARPCSARHLRWRWEAEPASLSAAAEAVYVGAGASMEERMRMISARWAGEMC